LVEVAPPAALAPSTATYCNYTLVNSYLLVKADALCQVVHLPPRGAPVNAQLRPSKPVTLAQTVEVCGSWARHAGCHFIIIDRPTHICVRAGPATQPSTGRFNPQAWIAVNVGIIILAIDTNWLLHSVLAVASATYVALANESEH